MLRFSSIQGDDCLLVAPCRGISGRACWLAKDCRMREDSGSKYSRIAASTHASWIGLVWQITRARVLSSCIQPRSAETIQGVVEVEVESKTTSYRRKRIWPGVRIGSSLRSRIRQGEAEGKDEGGSGLPRKTRHSWSTPGYDELGQVLRKMGTLVVTWEHKTRLRRPGRMGRCQPNFVPFLLQMLQVEGSPRCCYTHMSAMWWW